MNQSYEQEQQCFIPAKRDEQIYTSKQFIDDVLDFNLSSMLPSAKQILFKRKPLEMNARTCFLELNMKLYPSFLDQGDELISGKQQDSSVKNLIKNQVQKQIKDYFNPNEYKIIYNRISQYCSLRFAMSQMMNRFKNVSLYQQYNEKLFKNLKHQHQSKTPLFLDDDQFDSNFECGNLGKVYVKLQQQSREYYLLLENDVNSHGYTSWFFFRVRNCWGGTVKFHIINLVKNPTMFKNGMKVSIFSHEEWKKQKVGWYKGGENISVYQNNFPKEFKENSYYSTLYFQYDFKHLNDQVYFAMSRPYSYSRLTKFINLNFKVPEKFRTEMNESPTNQISEIDIRSDEEDIHQPDNIRYQINKSVTSICSNIIPIIQAWKGLKGKLDRKAIVFMGRQHPAEIVGSEIMEEVMDYFSEMSEKKQKNQLASELLENYLIVMIPMVNPDGVIHGNSRCNLAGLDLNRNWMDDSAKEASPETLSLRKYLWSLQKSNGIEYLIDLHGHSKKFGSFFFCNKSSSKNSPYYFPCILSKLEQRFDFSSCTFKTTPDKKNTLRNQLFEEGMKNCLTYQHSYFGYKTNNNTIISYTKKDFEQLAQTLLRGLNIIIFDETELDMTKFWKGSGLCKESIMSAAKQFEKNQSFIRNSKAEEEQQLELESDSEPEEGLLRPDEALKIFAVSSSQKKRIKRADSNNAEKKKIRSRKYQTATMKKKQNQQQDEVRQSYPLSSKYEEKEGDKKPYKSEKKINPVVPKRKSEFNRKSKPEELNSAENKSIFEKKIPNHQLTIKSEQKADKTRSQGKGARSIVSVFTNYPMSQMAAAQIKKKRQDFYATAEDIKHHKQKSDFPTTFNEKQIKTYLNETLSILKVNGLKPRRMNEEESQQMKQFQRKPQHQVFHKIAKSGMRVKTDNQKLSIGNEQQQGFERKKLMSRNFRKEILRRKKLLHDKQKDDSLKFKRFEAFADPSVTKREMKGSKVQGNSVFYHFPIL